MLALADVTVRGDRLVVAADGRPLDVVLRRTNDERLRDDEGALTPVGAALLGPLRAGTLRGSPCAA